MAIDGADDGADGWGYTNVLELVAAHTAQLLCQQEFRW